MGFWKKVGLNNVVDKLAAKSTPFGLYDKNGNQGNKQVGSENAQKTVDKYSQSLLGTVNRSGPGYKSVLGEISPVLLPMNYSQTGAGRYQQLANATGSGNQMSRAEWYGNRPVTIPPELIADINKDPVTSAFWRNLAVSSPEHFGQPQNGRPGQRPYGDTSNADLASQNNLGLTPEIEAAIAADPKVAEFWKQMAADPNVGLYFAEQAQMANTPSQHGPLNPRQIPQGWRPPDPKSFNTPTSYGVPGTPDPLPNTPPAPTQPPAPPPSSVGPDYGIPPDIAQMIATDPKVKAFWDELAANQNNPEYMARLNSLNQGYGISPDIQRMIDTDPAVKSFWSELAANQNNPQYMANLNSLAVPAVQYGSANSQTNIATPAVQYGQSSNPVDISSPAIQTNYGIPTDVQQAIASDPSVAAFWAELAANQNNPEYLARLRSLG